MASSAPASARSWEEDRKRAEPIIKRIEQQLRALPTTPLRILRVNQLDALRLDDELYDIMRSQFVKIFSFFQAGAVEQYQPELNALLQLLIFRLSIYASDTTYGNRLQNLTYKHAPTLGPMRSYQRLLYGLAVIGGPWAWARVNRHSAAVGWADLPETDWRKRLWTFMAKAETYWKAFALANLLIFLYDGKYLALDFSEFRSVVDRVLGLRLVYLHPTMARAVNFEWMNRQLVWHGFTEFLLFLMPLINVARIKNWISRRLHFATRALSPASSLQVSECPICSASPINTPYITSCQHLFCYFCLKQQLMIDHNYPCPRCGDTVSEAKRFEGTVDSVSS